MQNKFTITSPWLSSFCQGHALSKKYFNYVQLTFLSRTSQQYVFRQELLPFSVNKDYVKSMHLYVYAYTLSSICMLSSTRLTYACCQVLVYLTTKLLACLPYSFCQVLVYLTTKLLACLPYTFRQVLVYLTTKLLVTILLLVCTFYHSVNRNRYSNLMGTFEICTLLWH